MGILRASVTPVLIKNTTYSNCSDRTSVQRLMESFSNEVNSSAISFNEPICNVTSLKKKTTKQKLSKISRNVF